MKTIHKIIILFALIGLITFCCTGFMSLARSAEPSDAERYYTSICIQPDQTLWDIEKTYNTSHEYTAKEYIHQIKSMNHISGDTIHAGNYLTVIYYR